ncbi:hypothetical protein CXF86_19710 [Shewanella sp. GutCb]|uniref:hypothetical protein n=1 Tax=Shewanella sp. GutCb TaxID=2058315 RepID=UPI000C79583A|nr:hypothetical protein [Shewanella sp. GutCb]PKG73047.1 hypothetical protein CXF86_19710 [Shewanella sp. GutCb]
MADYPSHFPPPLASDYALVRAPRIRMSKMVSGYQRPRALYASTPTQFSVSFYMPRLMAIEFENWIEMNASRGEFNVYPLRLVKGVVKLSGRFIVNPTDKVKSDGRYWTFTGVLEVRDRTKEIT